MNLNFQSGHNFSPRPYPSLQKGLGKKKPEEARIRETVDCVASHHNVRYQAAWTKTSSGRKNNFGQKKQMQKF